MNKLLIIFPGIGYHCDKPLLYFGRILAAEEGYENCINLSYSCDATNIRGNKDKMNDTFETLYGQTKEALKDISFDDYSDVLFISKSIGTIIAVTYASEHTLKNVRHILYTPLLETFNALEGKKDIDAIAFIGSKDPWSNVPLLTKLADKENIPMHLYEGVNHSLEGDDTLKNIELLKDVCDKTKAFISLTSSIS